MRRRASGSAERHLIAVAAAALGLFDTFFTAFRAPLSGFGQIEDVVPEALLNGSRFALVIIGILLLAAVPGLWHGKRFAWAIALACAVASAFLHPAKNVDLWGTAGSIALAGALIGGRPLFPARSDPPTALRGFALLAFGLAAVFAYSVMGLYFLDREFRHPVTFAEAVEDTLRLLFIVPASQVEPRTGHGTWFVDSVRVAFLFVMVLGVTQLLRPVIHRARVAHVERERVRALLERYATTSLAHFALLPDKAYFFSESGDAVLAYKVVGSTAVVMGDPLGDPGEFDALLYAFQEHCALDGWAYAFHQATPAFLPLYARHGMKSLKIGEEALVDVQAFSLSGTAAKHLRATMNRFARMGYRAEVLRPPHDAALLRRLREISDAWLARGGRRERTFTLGQFDEAALQACDLVVARAPDGEVRGFANIVPSYRSQVGNYDLLRYDDEPKAIGDFLVLSLIAHFRDAGCTAMTLGLAPFSGIEPDGSRSPAARAMQLLYRRGTFLFRYTGLREFKEKFFPRWEPRYLIYSSELQLPGIALAVARAGEVHHGPHIDLPVPPEPAGIPSPAA
ncbi:MAG TPA: phosphatidylglycerol lysyltransferase domain-containing protein [Dehalococcoidia bacterium]|nr:phosphatidylglycerol lysyltransferase domain-containing protein [Dehalococcoidia bacterium]